MDATRSQEAPVHDNTRSNDSSGVEHKGKKRRMEHQEEGDTTMAQEIEATGNVATAEGVKGLKDVVMTKYTFMDLPTEIRLSIYDYVFAAFADMTVTPLALLDLPQPSLKLGLLLANREIAREAYEVFGSITQLKLYTFRPTTVEQLELMREGQPLGVGFEELFGHLPYFKNVTITTGGAKRTDIDMLEHLNVLTQRFMDHPNVRVAHLTIQFPKTVMAHFCEDGARMGRWHEMCSQLCSISQKMKEWDGELRVEHEVRSLAGISFQGKSRGDQMMLTQGTESALSAAGTEADVMFEVEEYVRATGPKRGLYAALWSEIAP